MTIAWDYPGQEFEVIPAKFSRTSAPDVSCAMDESCGAMLDTWTGISGVRITDLIAGTNNFTNAPNISTRLMSLLEGPTNVGDNYGSRMKGWLRPPVTGDYLFWIASDDEGEFWLSTDSDPENKERACYQLDYANQREWTKYPDQKSRPIPLVAGRAYYYEVRNFLACTR